MFAIQCKLLKSIHYFFYLLTFFLLFQACEKSSSPLEPLPSQYTSHDYEWEIDTLEASDAMQIFMYDIWGTDENDVWTVGHSDDYDYQIWHWDGSIWTNINPGIIGDRPSFFEIIGFSGNDIWVVGEGVYQIGIDPRPYYRDYILHYNGAQWIRYHEVKAPICLSVWGTSSTDMYFGCDSGVVLYFDGSIWQKQNTNTDAQICSIWGFNQDHIYATGYSWSDQKYYFFKKENDQWESQGNGLYRDYGNFIWGLDLEHFYRVTGNGIQQYQNGFWEYILSSSGLNCIFGNFKNNIFVAGYKNKFFHYNGNTWHQYLNFEEPDKSFDGIWCNSNCVFLIMGSLTYTYMVRGYHIQK